MAVATTSQSTAPPNGASPDSTPNKITELVADRGPRVDTTPFPQDVQTSAMRSIPLSLIRPSQTNPRKTNPRKQFDGPEFDELVESVKLHGVIVPVLVRHRYAFGAYELVAGERRFRAANEAGLKEIPAIVRDLTDEQAQEFQIIENLQRKDVTPMEEAEGYLKLFATYTENSEDYPRAKIVDELARKVGKSTRYIYARMKLAELQPEVKQAIADGKLPASHGDELVRLPAEQQKQLVKQILATPGGAPSVRDVRKAVKRASKPAEQPLSPQEKLNLKFRALSRKLHQDIDLRGEIMQALDEAKAEFAKFSPFGDELRAYAHGLELDRGVVLLLADKCQKPYGTAEQKFVNAQTEINRVVFQVNRTKPDRDAIKHSAASAVRALFDGLQIMVGKVELPASTINKGLLSEQTKQGLAGSGKAKAGTCRFCGCTQAHACVLEHRGKGKTPVTCSWVDAFETVCSNPECVKKLKAEQKSAKPKVAKKAAKKAAKKGGRR